MKICLLMPGYAVSPQIAPGDMRSLADTGYATVICNRPDSEVLPAQASAAMRAAAETAGLRFIYNPVGRDPLTDEIIATQRTAIRAATDGAAVFAYCASGNRSSIVWALSEADRLDAGQIIAAAARWGFGLEQFRPMIEARRAG